MPVQVIRHACAVDKHLWSGRDRDRPLDATGVCQAGVLAGHFARWPCHRVLSSPALRCVQSVAPLAHRHGLSVEQFEELGPDGDVVDLRHLIVSLDASAGVICTHGELMRRLLAEFRNAATPIASCPSSGQVTDDDLLLRKGTGWTLTLGPTGTIVDVVHQVPFGLPRCLDHLGRGV